MQQAHGMQGIGIHLGDLANGTFLVGIDLDSCIDDAGDITDWAEKLLNLQCTYAETSPSGTGIKLFFSICSDDARPLLRAISVPDRQHGCKRTINANGQKHGPAIEFYASHRYFTVTDRHWPGRPEQVALIEHDVLAHLAGLIPRPQSSSASSATARTAAKSPPQGNDSPVDTAQLNEKLAAALRRYAKLRQRYEGDSGGLADTSRSGRDMSLGALLIATGFSYAEMRAVLIEWQHGAGQEHAADDRYFRRIWERTAVHPLPVATIRLRGGLRHEAATRALVALTAAGVPFYRRDGSLVFVSACRPRPLMVQPSPYQPSRRSLSRCLVARLAKLLAGSG